MGHARALLSLTVRRAEPNASDLISRTLSVRGPIGRKEDLEAARRSESERRSRWMSHARAEIRLKLLLAQSGASFAAVSGPHRDRFRSEEELIDYETDEGR